MTTAVTDQAQDPVAGQAVAWIARVAQTEPPNWQDPELQAWLAESASHREAFAKACGDWFAAQCAPEQTQTTDSSQLDRHASVGHFRNRSWPTQVFGFAATLAVVAGLMTYVFGWSLANLWYTHSGTPGQIVWVNLSDGSEVGLSGDARLNFVQENGQRKAYLAAGRAFFDVAHDPSQPFSVQFGSGQLAVLGTRFTVRETAETWQVALLDGSVALESSAENRVIMVPGDRYAVGDTLEKLENPNARPIDDWQTGGLLLENQSFEATVARLQALSGRTIFVRGNPTSKTVTVQLDLSSLDNGIRSVASQAGLNARKVGNIFILSS